MRWLLGAYADRRTYGALGYLLLGLPLGVFGFTVAVTGISAGLGLLVTLAGIPVLVVTLLFVRAFAGLQRGLARAMVDAPMPRRGRQRPGLAHGLWWHRLRELLRQRATWRELGFVALVGLPLGIVGFTIAVVVVALMFGGFAQPIVVATGMKAEMGSWVIDTVPESLAFIPVSIAFLLVGPRMLNGCGRIGGRVAAWFLGRLDRGELKAAVAEVLSANGAKDGFAILDALELRFGRGPFLTPTRVAAALVALESGGHVSAHEVENRTVYGLPG